MSDAFLMYVLVLTSSIIMRISIVSAMAHHVDIADHAPNGGAQAAT